MRKSFQFAGKMAGKSIDMCGLLGGGLLACITLIVFYEVVARYFFNAPTTWSIDISTILLLWATFLGAAYTLKEKSHVGVDVIKNKLPPSILIYLDLLTNIFVGAFVVILTWRGAQACIDAFIFDEVTLSYLRIPQYIPMAAIPAGGILLMFQVIFNIAELWRSLRQ